MDNMDELQNQILTSLQDYLPSAKRYSVKQLATRIGKEKLEEASDQIFDYITNSCGELSRTEFMAMLSQIWRCLGEYIKVMNIPVTINTLTQNVHLTSFAVDRCFPGYASTGLLKCIIRPTDIKTIARVRVSVAA